MNSYLSFLFNEQTTILRNYVLSKLICFFMTPEENDVLLYETISKTKDVTKKELMLIGKKVPNTQKYSVHAQRIDDMLVFSLQLNGFSSISFYSVVLSDSPSIHALKVITKIIVSRYRPIPTKVDNEFSILATLYSEYLSYYQIKKSWQNGYIPNYNKIGNSIPYNSIISSNYDYFLGRLLYLSNTYKAFTKIIIDIYTKKMPKKYIAATHIYTLEVSYSEEFGISAILDDSNCQLFVHEIIPLKNFSPGNSFFNNKFDFVKGITSALYLDFNKV